MLHEVGEMRIAGGVRDREMEADVGADAGSAGSPTAAWKASSAARISSRLRVVAAQRRKRSGLGLERDAQLEDRDDVAHRVAASQDRCAACPASAAGVASTKEPMPCRVSTSPPACRREIASRTTVRLTPRSRTISDSVGSLSPALSSPAWILRVSSAINS
jgi:hypothetical protein